MGVGRISEVLCLTGPVKNRVLIFWRRGGGVLSGLLSPEYEFPR
jgi:hypothetical protein